MRGPLRRPLVRAASLCVLALFLAQPVLGTVTDGSGPLADLSAPLTEAQVPDHPTVPTEGPGSPFAWIERVEMERLEARALAAAETFGPTRLPRPDVLPGYDALPDDQQRVVWQTWLTLAQAATNHGGGFPAQQTDGAPGGNASAAEIGAPRGLTGIMSLDSHGGPGLVLPAGDEGETFVITDRGVLRFPAAGAAPDWLVKPGGYVSYAETTDVDADGVLDIVLGMASWWAAGDPSIAVVDGANGTLLWSGLTDTSSVYDWTLTDLDGDGTDELIGVTITSELIAHELDGGEIYRGLPDHLPAPDPVSLPLLYLHLYYDAYEQHTFGDFDGDGAKDFMILSQYQPFLSLVSYWQSAPQTLLSAHSSADLSPLWTVPLEPLVWHSMDLGGDHDMDGIDDVLLRTRFDAGTIGADLEDMDTRILSGFDGQVLAQDHVGSVRTCPTSECVDLQTTEHEHWPIAIKDMDGDGTAELVSLTGGDAEAGSFVINGRATLVRGGPLVEVWAHEVSLGKAYDRTSLYALMFRDVDADGTEELMVFLGTEDRATDGAIEDMAVHVFQVEASGATGGRMPELLGYWDVGGDGQAYGWTMRDDRWRPLDEAGKPQADGLRLVTNAYPLLMTDHTRDGIPDLFMRKSIGYMWIDGRTGKLLEDIERPVETYTYGIYEERGEYRLLERDWGKDTISLLSLKTFEPVWSFAREELEDAWLRDLADVTGDGKLDVIIEKTSYNFESDGDDGFFIGGGSREETTRVMDMTTQEVVWERDTSDAWVYFSDILPGRRGAEIVLREEVDDERALALYVVGEESPRWTYAVGDGGFRSAAHGYLLLTNRQEGEVFEVLAGDTGELLASYPLPADGFASDLFFMRIDKDRFPEIVVSVAVELTEEEYEQELIVYDWAREKEVSRFPLQTGEPRKIFFDDYVFIIPSLSYISASVGDWDGDGYTDFGFREADKPVVRSTRDGAVLAVAPGDGSIIRAVDMNGDGTDEIGVYTDTGRLRYFTYAPHVTAADLKEEDTVRKVTNIEGGVAEEAAEDFFKDSEDTPVPGPMLFLAALGAALAVMRRRR